MLEAMKMEHTLAAPRAATVDKVLVSEGEQVQDGRVLVTLTSDEQAAAPGEALCRCGRVPGARRLAKRRLKEKKGFIMSPA